jgi:hypothetical protein
MEAKNKHKWVFASRFRRGVFGWRSQPAITRIREAVSEIKKVARRDPVLGAEGAVRFLEKISPAIENIDGSSGSIGAAVNKAIEELAAVIAKAPAEDDLRRSWLERLWAAVEADDIPYLERLPEYWGDLCASPERASLWADDFMDVVRLVWKKDREYQGYYIGIPACLSSLFAAGRYDEILELLEMAPYKSWSERKWGVKAHLAMGRKDEALRYAEESAGLNVHPALIAEACEEILLGENRAEEAYVRYALAANQKTTYLATFNAIVRKYQSIEPSEILKDLVDSTPGEEGKWFAAAKSAGLYEEAAALANRSPCDPRTLTRVARDLKEKKPQFAVEAGLAALRWLIEGAGYEIKGQEVLDAFDHTTEAAGYAETGIETAARIRDLLTKNATGEGLVREIIEGKLREGC